MYALELDSRRRQSVMNLRENSEESRQAKLNQIGERIWEREDRHDIVSQNEVNKKMDSHQVGWNVGSGLLHERQTIGLGAIQEEATTQITYETEERLAGNGT
ncbi:hypothetical protein V6N11_036004 [Hibiscus sabdariffa]|uniref:Uncharacterized protein n=1 Tax=Hibiscus sabdariffa TaxID=183260 RepID=A0ABR2R9V5_9ROSI